MIEPSHAFNDNAKQTTTQLKAMIKTNNIIIIK